MGKLIGGGIFIFIGLFMLLGVLVSKTDHPLTTDLAMFFLFIATPIGLGSLLIRSHFKGKQKSLQEQKSVLLRKWEKEIIRLAQKKHGRLSIPDIVAETSMNTIEADEIMREMTGKGYVDMQVSDSGVIIYEFYEIAHRSELQE